jgi:hypothetical protein
VGKLGQKKHLGDLILDASDFVETAMNLLNP